MLISGIYFIFVNYPLYVETLTAITISIAVPVKVYKFISALFRVYARTLDSSWGSSWNSSQKILFSWRIWAQPVLKKTKKKSQIQKNRLSSGPFLETIRQKFPVAARHRGGNSQKNGITLEREFCP